MDVPIPLKFQPICDAFLNALTSALGEKLHAVYLHGAVVFPEAGTVKDIDFHVILDSPFTSEEVEAIKSLHADLAEQFPSILEELDCYYILLADAQQSAPPQHQLDTRYFDDMWPLHRAHWLAGRCVVLHGPNPEEIIKAPTWPELATALRFELSEIEKLLNEYPAYCVLNLCRVMYSFETTDVVTSKRASALRIRVLFPEWAPVISAAVWWYEDQVDETTEELLATGASQFHRFALDRIHKSPNWNDITNFN